MRIRTTLLSHGRTATGVDVPEDAVTALGSGRRPKVKATIKGHTYRSSVARMGGVYDPFLRPVTRSASGHRRHGA